MVRSRGSREFVGGLREFMYPNIRYLLKVSAIYLPTSLQESRQIRFKCKGCFLSQSSNLPNQQHTRYLYYCGMVVFILMLCYN